MTTLKIIQGIEEAYKTSDLVYEMMVGHFFNLSGFAFHAVTIKQGSPLVRARYTNQMKSLHTLDEISYPKREYVTKFSRLNRPGQNLFYASESEKTCLAEMLPFWFDEFELGEIKLVTLGKWTVRNDLKLLVIPDTQNSNELSKKVISLLQKPEIEFWNYISGKFRTTTKEDPNIYELTSAFGNALWLNALIQNTMANGFIYSSVQSPKSMNVALNTQTIDAGYLTPSEFVEIQIQKTGYTRTGLPHYKMIGDKRQGFIDMEKQKISWI
jgi:hypothetical protein